MTERLLLERPFIFDADHEKGYCKLRDNQFPRIEQGIVFEPLANALDQQQGDEPVEVTLAQDKAGWMLTFRDNGSGLTSEHLEALHLIGKSTKRDNKGESIGRFGMGLVGAFHKRLGISQAEIITMLCGRPARVLIDCSGPGIPLWWLEELPDACQGFSISFRLPEKTAEMVGGSLKGLLAKIVVPIIFNGKRYENRPNDLLRTEKGDLIIYSSGDPELHYAAHCSQAPFRYNTRDQVAIHLRGLPVEVGEMYRLFVSSGGDKMPQNFYGVPYMRDESCLILSRTAEPTVGRDTLVRNGAFDAIGKALYQSRVDALRKLFALAADAKVNDGLAQYAEGMAVANFCSLRAALCTLIKGEPPESGKEYLVPLLNDLLDYPVLPISKKERKISVRRVLDLNTPVILYAESMEAADFLDGMHSLPFILREEIYSFSPLWGWYDRRLLVDVVKQLIECSGRTEVIMLDDLMMRDDKLQELISRGIIRHAGVEWRPLQSPEKKVDDFMGRLSATLNSHWFRRSVSRFNPPRRINLAAMEVTHPHGNGEIIAGLLGGSRQSAEMTIGINVGCSAVVGILRHPSGHLAFLPILCHELAHRRRNLRQEESTVPHDLGFYLDRVRLETSVLTACVRSLLGEEADGCEDELDGGLGEVVVI